MSNLYTHSGKEANTARNYLPCPYCDVSVSSLRENMLTKLLTRHKREHHREKLEAEIEAQKAAALGVVGETELVEVAVSNTYYTHARFAERYPARKTVLVPAAWNVLSVAVHITSEGKMIAYRGALGRGEGWEVT